MISPNQRLVFILLGVGVLLLIPAIAMLFTTGVNWGPFDFLIMGLMLLVTGLGCELVLRSVKQSQHRLILCGIVLLIFILMWAELAVGIFGTPFAGS